MGSRENIKTVVDIFKNENIPISFAIYEKNSRTFCVYTYQQVNVNNSDNIQNLYETRIRLTIYTENDFLELKDRLQTLLKDSGFIVNDSGYSGRDNETKLNYFTLELIKEE